MNVLRKFFSNFILLLSMTGGIVFIAQAASPSYETVSRCFFVYAGIIEAGRDSQHSEVYSFAQSRVGWVGGYVQANQENQEFKQVFEAGLRANKQVGLQLKATLISAISSRNVQSFSIAIQEAAKCDRLIGIHTGSGPRLLQ